MSNPLDGLGEERDATNAERSVRNGKRTAAQGDGSALVASLSVQGAPEESAPLEKVHRRFRVAWTTGSSPKLVSQVERCLHEAATPSAAIRHLATRPGLLEVDLVRMEERARETLKDFLIRAIMPTEHFHSDGKVTYRSNDFEGAT
jgi:hypothetical protein